MSRNDGIESNSDIKERLDRLTGWYGDGADGSAPTRNQWQALLERPAAAPITIVNFFKLRDRAAYGKGAETVSGREAFDRYAAVSGPALEKAGGRFLVLASFEATFMGADEDWDLVVVGSYPDSEALLALHEDPDYRAVYLHRTAALERQKVFACGS